MTPALLKLLLEAALRALVGATAAWASLRVLRVRNLVAQKAAWAMVLAASLAAPLFTGWQWTPGWAELRLPMAVWPTAREAARHAPTRQMNAPPPASDQTEPITRWSASSVDRFPSQPQPADEGWPPTYAVPGPNPAAALHHGESPAAVSEATSLSSGLLAATWILYFAGCAVLLFRLLWGLATSLWLWSRAKPVELPASLNFPRSIAVNSSARIASPVNIGSGILLPADHGDWNEEKLRVVLAHERSHIQQRDFYLQLLAGLYTAFTWFSPLGWWLKKKLSDLGEAISDRAGLEAAASPSAYAGMLLEFAAMPRPTLNGVAMAHSSNLSHRIERFLNDSSYRLAFAGGRRALASLAIPAVLVAASIMIRVQAATVPAQTPSSQTSPAEDQPGPQAQTAGQSNPVPAQVTDSGQAPEPAAPPVPEAAPAPPAPAPGPAPDAAPAPSTPPAPQAGAQQPMPTGPGGFTMPAVPPMPPIHVEVNIPPMPPMPMMSFGRDGFCFPNGDSYVIVGDAGTKPQYCGNWDSGNTRNDLEKARSMAHGHFLLFRHDGKLYIFDDPAEMSQIEAMEKSRQDVGEQMRALGKQMREAGAQMREQGRIAREAANKIPAPDLSKEIAELDASAANLKSAQGGTVSREQLQQLQREISELQRQVIQAEVGANMKEFNSEMGKFAAQQGALGGQMGKLGAQMGQMSRENNEKIRSIIDESLKDGKAKPLN